MEHGSVMTQQRSIVINGDKARFIAINAINNLPIDGNSFFEVVIRVFKKKRSNDQNNLYWVRLGEISKQAWIDGRQFTDDVIHEHVKRELLPDTCTKGIEKWMILPSGERTLKMSTGDLNTKEFAEYFTQVEAFAADLGVMMSDSRHYE